jgi:DNA-binding transcriptional MerR regulator
MKTEHLRKYTSGHVLDITGIPYRTLDHWNRNGFLSPTIQSGEGRERIYSFGDVIAVFTATLGRKLGISLKAMSKLIPKIQRAVGNATPASTKARVDTVMFVSPDGTVHTLRDKRLTDAMRKWGHPVMGAFHLDAVLTRAVNRTVQYRVKGMRPRRGRPTTTRRST